jgi:ankyrin repeat protein
VILESGTLDQVRAVLNGLPPGEINNPNKQGHTALQLAVKAGDEELVRLLMQYGSDID